MTCNKLTAQVNKHTVKAQGKTLIRLVGFLLLVFFVGRLTVDSISSYAGIKKANTTLIAADQDDNDDKEEHKYVDQQLKFFTEPVNFEPVSLFGLAKIKLRFTSSMCYIASHYLTVLTPPPNC